MKDYVREVADNKPYDERLDKWQILAIDVLKVETEGIKAIIKELVAKNVQGKNILDNLHCSQSKNDEPDNIKKRI